MGVSAKRGDVAVVPSQGCSLLARGLSIPSPSGTGLPLVARLRFSCAFCPPSEEPRVAWLVDVAGNGFLLTKAQERCFGSSRVS